MCYQYYVIYFTFASFKSGPALSKYGKCRCYRCTTNKVESISVWAVCVFVFVWGWITLRWPFDLCRFSSVWRISIEGCSCPAAVGPLRPVSAIMRTVSVLDIKDLNDKASHFMPNIQWRVVFHCFSNLNNVTLQLFGLRNVRKSKAPMALFKCLVSSNQHPKTWEYSLCKVGTSRLGIFAWKKKNPIDHKNTYWLEIFSQLIYSALCTRSAKQANFHLQVGLTCWGHTKRGINTSNPPPWINNPSLLFLLYSTAGGQ